MVRTTAAGGHIALFIKSLIGGGAERTFVTLARAFLERGHRVDLVLSRARGPLLAEVAEGVRVVELGMPRTAAALPSLLRLPISTWRHLPAILRHNRPKATGSLPALVRYLETERPDALLSTLDSLNIVATWAKWLTGVELRVVVRQASTLSETARHTHKVFERNLPALAGRWYPRADGIVAVSDGVADDLAVAAGVPRTRVTTIHNPVDLARVGALAESPLEDPWLQSGTAPVFLAVGRLKPQKDYGTLLRALAQARAQRDLRLIILGEGSQRAELERLAGELGVGDAVRMPGFSENPYAYMARARALVLSSASEGFPNVLVEALACGCPVISTDCPNGPAELLDRGAFGCLVPVGDPAAMARAMLAALDAPRNSNLLRRRAEEFSVDSAADAYLRLLSPP
jgi:glycosyltransferase involved in cell wall biosynthesis